MMRLVATSTLLLGCHRSAMSSCEELAQMAPKGVVLADTDARCFQMLDFAASIPSRYGVEFSEWLSTVPAQRSAMLIGTMDALTRGGWSPVDFGPFPPTPPCGPGFSTDQVQWDASPLASILSPRPDKLFVSLALNVDPNNSLLTIRVLQDFDCDQIVGVTEVEGKYGVGLPLFSGGWTTQRAVSPILDE